MRILGQILLWFGFLSGALATVIHAPPAGVKHVLEDVQPEDLPNFEIPDLTQVVIPADDWNLIPWGWFGGSVLVCLVGVVLIRQSKRATATNLDHHATSIPELLAALQEASAETGALLAQTEELAPSEITRTIDDQIADPLRRFAEGRDRISAEYDLDTFADVMTPFAAGERAINRAWSASADGYIDEAATCLKRGQLMLQEAHQVLTQRKESPAG